LFTKGIIIYYFTVKKMKRIFFYTKNETEFYGKYILSIVFPSILIISSLGKVIMHKDFFLMHDAYPLINFPHFFYFQFFNMNDAFYIILSIVFSGRENLFTVLWNEINSITIARTRAAFLNRKRHYCFRFSRILWNLFWNHEYCFFVVYQIIKSD
jgi:hypothetical protein